MLIRLLEARRMEPIRAAGSTRANGSACSTRSARSTRAACATLSAKPRIGTGVQIRAAI
jgi:hypothetical protein